MLQFALRRLALRRSSLPSLERRRTPSAILQPPGGPPSEALARDLDGRDLVVVPTGELHALSWALLPSLRAGL